MSSSQADRRYRRAINAWCMYDWANSAFATTILAAVLPVYYSQVAGATLPSEARATAYWSLGISVSLFIVAILSPILGTISDVIRGKKRFLAIFVGLGIVGTGLLVLVGTGDWLLASILFLVGRIGFAASNVFYDALLPHVAREEDRDWVSTRGYALGYLGGGALLAVNVVMIQLLPGTWGPRLSFLSVGIWWAVFSIPIFTRVAEPPAAPVELTSDVIPGAGVIDASFRRLGRTFGDLRQYRELFKYLLAFLIYNDGIGTVMSVSAIYGAELGFDTVELILALLLVQFVGIPFSLIFGRLPDRKAKRRPFFLALILFNLIAMPLVGVVGARVLPDELVGAPLPPYETVGDAVGEGAYRVDSGAWACVGAWDRETIPADEAGLDADVVYATSAEPGAQCAFHFNGQTVELTYSAGPDRGRWAVMVDGSPLIDESTGAPLVLEGHHRTVRHGVRRALALPAPGQHQITLVNTGDRHPDSQGTRMMVAQFRVLPPARRSNLAFIIGLIVGIEAVGAALAWLFGRRLCARWVDMLDTQRSIILALSVYAVISVWGYFLNSMIEFWLLAWMVAVVQGGSQALSRSLYASMSPTSKSGEFFGFYGVMEKFAAIVGPLLFAAAATIFDSSRPAVLSLIVIFMAGMYLLWQVDVEEGRRVARAEDRALLGALDE